jgi:hypothetical protein
MFTYAQLMSPLAIWHQWRIDLGDNTKRQQVSIGAVRMIGAWVRDSGTRMKITPEMPLKSTNWRLPGTRGSKVNQERTAAVAIDPHHF